ncbi:hypothetical protein HMPREF3212_01118 [Citrobacter freundii]|nr:hypothetical protein HMPREF3212_01118 [Citrobacter freundii]
MEYTITVFKLNADILFFICPVQTNMSSKLIFRSHHQLLLSGIGMHSTLFERNIVSSFSACPEYSLANVEHLLARKQSGNHQIS